MWALVELWTSEVSGVSQKWLRTYYGDFDEEVAGTVTVGMTELYLAPYHKVEDGGRRDEEVESHCFQADYWGKIK